MDRRNRKCWMPDYFSWQSEYSTLDCARLLTGCNDYIWSDTFSRTVMGLKPVLGYDITGPLRCKITAAGGLASPGEVGGTGIGGAGGKGGLGNCRL